MSFADRVLAYKDLGDSAMIARAVYDEFKVDLDKEVARLNSKAPELGAGTTLFNGVREAVDSVLRNENIATVRGLVRAYIFNHNLEPEPTKSEMDNLVGEVREGVQRRLNQNAEERKAGTFTHLLDCTVAQITTLAARYRSRANSYMSSARTYEWIVEEAISRGLSPDDKLGQAFTEAELSTIPQIETNQQTFELEPALIGD